METLPETAPGGTYESRLPSRLISSGSVAPAPLAALESDFMQALDPHPDSIAIEVDVERHDFKTYRSRDVYTGEQIVEQKTIRSGNGPIVFAVKDVIDEQIRGRWQFSRECEGLRFRREIEMFFQGDAECIPGELIVLTPNYGAIIDRLALEESKDLWLRLRRLASGLREWPFTIPAPNETRVYPFQDARGNRKEERYWGWAWGMRTLVDGGIGTKGPRLVREFSNVDRLPSRAQIAATGKAPINMSKAMLAELHRDMELRGERLAHPDLYNQFNGHWLPSLAGTSEVPGDFNSIVTDRR